MLCPDLASGPSNIKLIFGGMFRAFDLPDVAALTPLIGFAAFAYSYHYLNWFLKTERTGWHRISLRRTALIALLWMICEISWVYDPMIGFYLTVPLSFGHVIMELPLNFITIRRLLSYPRVIHG